MTWITARAANDDVHVVPLKDIIEHDEDGSMRWLVCHHSLDGREERE